MKKCKKRGQGVVKNCARYPGSYVETDAKSNKTTQYTKKNARENFYYLSGVWTTDLPINLKMMVFNATVTSALLS